MKRILVSFVFLFSLCAAFSQTVTLSFTGRGRGGINTEEIYQQIDSMQVRNITRQWEQMIYYPDTVVLLEALAVPMLDVKQSGLEQNVPNPFNCVTEARLNLFEDDNVTLQVIDASGKKYLSYKKKMPAGEHLFEITLAVPQTYFLTATTSTGKYMVKMVNLGSCGTNSMVLKSSSEIQVRSKGVIANEFDLGDQMEYFAYTTYNNIVFEGSLLHVQNGSEDITIHFNIPYCTYTLSADKRYGCEYLVLDGVTYYEDTQAAAVLRLTSAGGCDSVVVLDVVIDHPTETECAITACQPIYWNGISCTSSGFYYADLFTQGGCDSIVTLHFTRADSIVHHVYESDCISATWNGETFYETGEYIRHFQSQYYCDSIVHFHFRNLSDDVVESIYACDEYTWVNGHTYYGNNNTDTVHLINQNGCDSIVRLNLVLNHTSFNRIDRLACGQFDYNGHTYFNSGVYTETLSNPYTGCDSIVELHLTVIHDTIIDIYEHGCDSFVFDGQTYTQPNVYDIHYHPNNYCDSIVRLHLTIGHNTYSEQNVVACDSYTWFGNEYTTSGDYTHVITWGNHEGCDSIITLHLTINNSVTSEKIINACRMYNLEGERITESCTRVITYTAANGCDSTVTYTINIYGSIATEFTQYACESFEWQGETFYESGNYERVVPSVLYCDSTVTMHLFVGEPNYGIEVNQTACDSYVWNGHTYTTSGTYTGNFTNIYGCDSVVTLRLTINQSYSNIEDVVTECDSYEWEGDVYTETGSYTKTLHSVVTGCDSVVTLHLTIKHSVTTEFSDTSCGVYVWDGRNYSSTGDHIYEYPAANGCDSIVTLHLVYHELVVDDRSEGYTNGTSNVYCTMEYGDQVWMTENMRYLPQVDKSSSRTVAKYYVYGYAPTGTASLNTATNNTNYRTYGTLYNYVAAQTACPEGWRLPTQSDWEQLFTFLRSNPEYYCNDANTNVAKSIASKEYWNSSSNACAVGNDASQNNSSGFNGLPGGYGSFSANASQITSNNFSDRATATYWWSATEQGSTAAFWAPLKSSDAVISPLTSKSKAWGLSVRCVKDRE